MAGEGAPRGWGHEPLVSVVTPVFNGETYLGRCIESVRVQDYENWEHVVVDNCSTDRTAEIVRRYAAREPRLRLARQTEFLPLIENWNRAMRQMSPESAYCKVLHADDELLPACLSSMVALAERHPRVGVVGAYTVSGGRVKLDGVPYPEEVIPGPRICRETLLGGPWVFGSPTALLVRSNLVRDRHEFYDPAELHADVTTAFDLLSECDFGFVHQVLTHTRVHDGSETSRVASRLYTYKITQLFVVKRYGTLFLSDEERRARFEEVLDAYYRFLAVRLIRRRRDARFWAVQREGLERIGERLEPRRLAAAWIRLLWHRATHPVATARGRRRTRRERRAAGRPIPARRGARPVATP